MTPERKVKLQKRLDVAFENDKSHAERLGENE